MGSFACAREFLDYLFPFFPSFPHSCFVTERRSNSKQNEDQLSRMRTFSSSGLSEKECKVSQSQFLQKIEYFHHLLLQEKTYQLYYHRSTDGEERQTGTKLLPTVRTQARCRASN